MTAPFTVMISSGVVRRGRLGTVFPHFFGFGNAVPTRSRLTSPLLILATHQATVAYGSFCCNCKATRRQFTLATKPRKDKYGMVSEICNRQKNAQLIDCSIIPLTSYKFEQKSNVLVKTLTFLLVTVVLAKVRGFKLVIG